MKKLFVSIHAIISAANEAAPVFEKTVIISLYKIQRLGYDIILVVEDALLVKPGVQQAINILNSELTFSISNAIETISNADEFLIEKMNGQFLVKNGEGSKLVYEWNGIFDIVKSSARKISHTRNTNETKISIEMNLDGNGVYNVDTGLNFFNHMAEQLSKHSLIDLNLKVDGDLHIDEHHTIEDTAIALGEAVSKALGNKRGIERYGFLLPMDDCLAQVAIDFGGRAWLVWDVQFRREYVGDVPTEMFYHFFKSFSDAAKCNLNIKAEGDNEHHKIESIFKAFAKAIKMAVAVNENSDALPTTKGML
ncbi:imidazoleglycerol-phosphate dehydratase HisB [Parafilimonas sp.]|uniref:imidazoleglycerol-phosphate dehydratase HisB n=1 Tax=Parafilimonas sp. TaxID=1969739 RepID=UPI0039E2D71A